MNNLLYFKKRITEAQAHEELSAKHSDFDHKSWWRSVGRFWLAFGGFVILLTSLLWLGEAYGCGVEEGEGIKIETVRGI